MGIAIWVVIGALVGLTLKFFTPGRDPGGIVMKLVLGVGGAVAGGLIGWQLGWGGIDQVDFRALVLAAIGTAVALGVHRKLTKAPLIPS